MIRKTRCRLMGQEPSGPENVKSLMDLLAEVRNRAALINGISEEEHLANITY